MLSITLGIFTRDASDRLCYEVYTLDSSMYMIVSYMIVEHFYLTSTDHLVDGFDGLWHILFKTTRPVAKDEQLLIDYGESFDGFEF